MAASIAIPQVHSIPTVNAPPRPEGLSLNSLKAPDSTEPSDTCPVIVWGDYTYWPLSFVDNRYALCLVAYDAAQNVVGRWEFDGYRYIVSATVRESNRTVVLVCQENATLTVTWNGIGTVSPMNPQSFWILSSQTPGSALTWGGGGSIVKVAPLAVSDSQLWLFDPGRQAIFSRTTGPGLALTAPSTPGSPLTLAATDWGQSGQRWQIDPDGSLIAVASDLVATEDSRDSVTVRTRAVPASFNQRWFLQPYLPAPDVASDQLPNLLPGQPFSLRNRANPLAVLAASGGAGSALTLQPHVDGMDPAGTWVHDGGAVVNPRSGLAITASGNSAVGSPPTGDATQVWWLTTDGFLGCAASGLVLEDNNGTLALSPYNALRPDNQNWMLQTSPGIAAPGPFPKRSVDSEGVLGPADNIRSLTVTAQLADDWWAGTADRISITLGRNSARKLLFQDPSRGASVTLNIELYDMFGKDAINVGELTHVWLFQDPVPHPIASDAWKLKSIILKANGQYTNYTFQKVNKWIDNPDNSIEAVWVGAISWGSWLDENQKPIDLNCQTYKVGLLPYIGDIKSWRSYDPSTIDGVGQLVGMLNGKLIGELLKTRQCEELRPTDATHTYTWVYTPEGAIIYKPWDKNDKAQYTRHSQLGSGAPVICAGELEIQQEFGFNGVTSVIGMVNDASGHYRPDGGVCLWNVAKKLQELGIPTDRTGWYWHDGS